MKQNDVLIQVCLCSDFHEVVPVLVKDRFFGFQIYVGPLATVSSPMASLSLLAYPNAEYLGCPINGFWIALMHDVQSLVFNTITENGVVNWFLLRKMRV